MLLQSLAKGRRDTREAQYPLAGMSSAVQRETVKVGLATPLAQRGCVGMAFRILWRNNQDAIWKRILTQRAACDKFIHSLHGVSLILSSITGLVGKSSNTPDGKIVNPGLAYWIVLDSPEVDPRDIARQVQAVLQGQAELKLLQEPPLISNADTMHSTMCTVMKDHNNSYVRRRIQECFAMTGDPSTPAGPGYPCRLVTQYNDVSAQAINYQAALNQGGVFIDVVNY